MGAFSIAWYVAEGLFLVYCGWLLTFRTSTIVRRAHSKYQRNFFSEALVFETHALLRDLHLAVDSPRLLRAANAEMIALTLDFQTDPLSKFSIVGVNAISHQSRREGSPKAINSPFEIAELRCV